MPDCVCGDEILKSGLLSGSVPRGEKQKGMNSTFKRCIPRHGKSIPVARPLSFFIALGALAFTVLPANPVHAASILWNTPQPISQPSDVSLDGTLLYAYAFGSTGVPETTYNGVTFAPFAVANNSTLVTLDDVTLGVGAGGRITSTNGGTGANSAPFSFLQDDYQALLESGISTSNGGEVIILSMGGLTVGQNYLVEFWSNDSKNFTLVNQLGSNITSETVYTADNAVSVDNNIIDAKNGVGQWVTGYFTADDISQVVLIESQTPAGEYPVVNAFQVREVEVVPEPSTVMLVMIGLAATGLCRWMRVGRGRPPDRATH
jgi:hypothetical protein